MRFHRFENFPNVFNRSFVFLHHLNIKTNCLVFDLEKNDRSPARDEKANLFSETKILCPPSEKRSLLWHEDHLQNHKNENYQLPLHPPAFMMTNSSDLAPLTVDYILPPYLQYFKYHQHLFLQTKELLHQNSLNGKG